MNPGGHGDSPGHSPLLTSAPGVSTGDPVPQAAVGNESWFVGDSRAPGTSPGVGPPTRGTLAELEEDLARNFAGHPAVSLPSGWLRAVLLPVSLQLRPRCCKFGALRIRHHCVRVAERGSYRSDRKGGKKKK